MQFAFRVIGAGHAGLNAIKEIRKVTENYVLINGGQLGTVHDLAACLPRWRYIWQRLTPTGHITKSSGSRVERICGST
jgi:pyruvate/2-oxoglutarate dehydrogenase complex dihydrolipoamide dehydrogenase (E3) component